MPRIHVFADESGNFDFSRSQGSTRYFVLTTVAFAECDAVSGDLLRLRHQIAWDGHDHPGPFHANHDPQPVRERVFRAIKAHDFRVDALVLEKAKAMPRLRSSAELFYQYSWFYLMKYVAPQVAKVGDELLVVAASIGSKKKKREAFYSDVRGVMQQVAPTMQFRTACDACLQVADYCGWAIFRKWELGDATMHTLVAPKIASEYDLFAVGTTYYY